MTPDRELKVKLTEDHWASKRGDDEMEAHNLLYEAQEDIERLIRWLRETDALLCEAKAVIVDATLEADNEISIPRHQG